MGKRSWQLMFFLPLIGLYLWLIGGGFFQVFKESLGYIPTLSMTEISFDHYLATFLSKGFLRDLFYSLYIAVTAATLSVAIGTYSAFRLVRSRHPLIRKIISRVLKLGMVLPYLYMVFIVTLLLGRTGIYARLFHAFGLMDGLEDFPVLIQEPFGIGILMVFILKGIPFVTLFLMNIMAGISDTYGEVAESLGASPLQILRRVYVPLSSDTIVWALMILLAYDIGAFEVPYLLGSLKPQSLSIRLFSAYMSPSITTIPATMAMAVLLFVIGFAVVALYGLLLKKLLMRKSRLNFIARPGFGKGFRKATDVVAILLIVLTTFLPAVYIVLLSFNHFFRYPALLPSRPTLDYWQNLLMHNTLFPGSLVSSFLIAGTTALGATIIGFMAGRGIALHFRDKSSQVLMMVSLPLFIPGMSLFLGAHHALIHSPFINQWFGVVLVHMLLCIPYTTNIATAHFKGIPLELEQAAKNLGAAWPTSMRRLILPMVMPGVTLSLTMAFLISNTEYFATFLIGGGNTVTLSMIMYPYIANSDYGMGAVSGLTFLLIHLGVFWLLDRFLGRRYVHQGLYGEG